MYKTKELKINTYQNKTLEQMEKTIPGLNVKEKVITYETININKSK